ncbi:hypothetical protein [Pedobacter gandavensis]|uniref:Uncharacterized protein n=1 Tax=Pedobacter gandavensis TaxID=2679963 RepID=A0ABR6EVD4_9SPHI|nr:hypothetical protein [Pedobacter gandavensis]MBB2149167.1 hypothetical protein [Pedobacter gandavensis]
MAIAKISIWLNDVRRDYQYGVLLYNQFGKSELLKVLFNNGDSSYHQDRLHAALEELNPMLEELTNQSSFKIPTLHQMPSPSKSYGVPQQAWDKFPEPIKDLYGQSSKLHRHSQLLFDQARIAKSDEERLSYALPMLLERKDLNGNWKAIKDFHEKGKIQEKIIEQEKASVQDLSIAELTRQMKNIPSYLSKDKKRVIDMPAGPKKNKVMLRIQEHEVKLDLIKKRLEGMI